MACLILVNGVPPSRAMADALAARCDTIIAVDGAAAHALSLGLRPDIVCGDFDSIDMPAAIAGLPDARFVCTPDQSLSDLEKALGIALAANERTIYITGASGGRQDHELSAALVLLRCNRETEICILKDGAALWAISGALGRLGRLTLDTQPGDTVSILSADGLARITTEGLQWPLTGERLQPGTRGVSNVALRADASVTVEDGAVWVCHLYDRLLPWSAAGPAPA